MMPYERLTAWRPSHELVMAVYRVTGPWPPTEQFGLTGQTRRAALSAPTNIAEGSALKGRAQFRRHLDIALGSLSELSYLLFVARELEFLTPEEWTRVDDLRNRAGQLIWRLKESMAERRNAGTTERRTDTAKRASER